MNLFSCLAWSGEMPALMAMRLAGRPLGGLLDLAGVEGLQETWRLTSFSSSTWWSARRRSSVEECRISSLVGELDRRVGALEVEAGGRLAVGLVDGVADLLHVDLGDDVEAGHGLQRIEPASTAGRRCRTGGRSGPARDLATILRARGSVSEWPKEADCKSAGSAYGGSNPPRPTGTRGRGTARARGASGPFPPRRHAPWDPCPRARALGPTRGWDNPTRCARVDRPGGARKLGQDKEAAGGRGVVLGRTEAEVRWSGSGPARESGRARPGWSGRPGPERPPQGRRRPGRR